MQTSDQSLQRVVRGLPQRDQFPQTIPGAGFQWISPVCQLLPIFEGPRSWTALRDIESIPRQLAPRSRHIDDSVSLLDNHRLPGHRLRNEPDIQHGTAGPSQSRDDSGEQIGRRGTSVVSGDNAERLSRFRRGKRVPPPTPNPVRPCRQHSAGYLIQIATTHALTGQIPSFRTCRRRNLRRLIDLSDLVGSRLVLTMKADPTRLVPSGQPGEMNRTVDRIRLTRTAELRPVPRGEQGGEVAGCRGNSHREVDVVQQKTNGGHSFGMEPLDR